MAASFRVADGSGEDRQVVKEAEWQVELETGPAWLTDNNGTKRPIGFWNELLNAKWRFNIPREALNSVSRQDQPKAINIPKKNQIEPLITEVTRFPFQRSLPKLL